MMNRRNTLKAFGALLLLPWVRLVKPVKAEDAWKNELLMSREAMEYIRNWDEVGTVIYDPHMLIDNSRQKMEVQVGDNTYGIPFYKTKNLQKDILEVRRACGHRNPISVWKRKDGQVVIVTWHTEPMATAPIMTYRVGDDDKNNRQS